MVIGRWALVCHGRWSSLVRPMRYDHPPGPWTIDEDHGPSGSYAGNKASGVRVSPSAIVVAAS